jgi:hypothetical protein
MKKHPIQLFRHVVLTGVLFWAGCASMQTGSSRYDIQKSFYLTLVSDPPGANVVQERNGRNVVLGKTPLNLPFHFVKARGSDFLGQIGIKTWQHKDADISPWRLIELPGDPKYRLRLQGLTLKHDGYKEETFKYEWVLGKDFQIRNALGEVTGPEPSKAEARVVLRSPVKPEFYRTLELQSGTPGMVLSLLEEDAQKGNLIAELPMRFRFGFGRERDENGAVQKWLWWSRKSEQRIFSFASDGTHRLTAWATAPDYDSMVLKTTPVMNVSKPLEGSAFTKVLRMTTPQSPQEEFHLKVDSLPSNAEVFVVSEDGTLGGKFGMTPFEMKIGIGQKLKVDAEGNFLHDDWLVWMPNDLVRWKKNDTGATIFYLSCGLFREGFAMERVLQEVFRLVPGQTLPQSRTLTVPLLHPEQAAVRDASRLAPKPVPTPTPLPGPDRRPFIWKEPDMMPVPSPIPPEKKSFWRRIREK